MAGSQPTVVPPDRNREGWSAARVGGQTAWRHATGALIVRARRGVHTGWRAYRADGSAVVLATATPPIWRWFEHSRAAMSAALAQAGQ